MLRLQSREIRSKRCANVRTETLRLSHCVALGKRNDYGPEVYSSPSGNLKDWWITTVLGRRIAFTYTSFPRVRYRVQIEVSYR